MLFKKLSLMLAIRWAAGALTSLIATRFPLDPQYRQDCIMLLQSARRTALNLPRLPPLLGSSSLSIFYHEGALTSGLLLSGRRESQEAFQTTQAAISLPPFARFCSLFCSRWMAR